MPRAGCAPLSAACALIGAGAPAWPAGAAASPPAPMSATAARGVGCGWLRRSLTAAATPPLAVAIATAAPQPAAPNAVRADAVTTFFMLHLMACAWGFVGLHWHPTDGLTVVELEKPWVVYYGFAGPRGRGTTPHRASLCFAGDRRLTVIGWLAGLPTD